MMNIKYIRQTLFLLFLFQYSALAMAAAGQTGDSESRCFTGPFQSTQRSHQTSAAESHRFSVAQITPPDRRIMLTAVTDMVGVGWMALALRWRE